MKRISRRDVLKGGLAMPVAAAVGLSETANSTPSTLIENAPQSDSPQSALRKRLLLDFGWRFHFGHANDAKKDFGFGLGRSGGFQKTGEFLSPSHMAFDESDWTPMDLPHDWVISLPFKNDPNLTSKGSYPLGRDYPETSVGWYRRVFELPSSDAGKRISIEFDGAYRETMVVLNGYYIGRHSGGSTGGPIEEGKIDGATLSFKAGPTTYTGVVKGDELELMRSAPPRRGGGPPPAASTEPRPAIGPPPNGTDPSFGAGFGGRGGRPPAPLVLRRVKR